MEKPQESPPGAMADACGALIQTLIHQLTFSGVLTTGQAQTVFDLAEKRARQKGGMEVVAETDGNAGQPNELGQAIRARGAAALTGKHVAISPPARQFGNSANPHCRNQPHHLHERAEAEIAETKVPIGKQGARWLKRAPSPRTTGRL